MTDASYEREAYYDSANIAESYSGIVLPLTASFARMVYERAYADLLAASGVPKRMLARHAYVFRDLLAFFHGRMYYRMTNWYRMAAFVPGYRRNKANFERMITSNLSEPVHTDIRPSFAFTLRYPWIILAKLLSFGSAARRFRRETERELSALRRTDFESLSHAECRTLFARINEKLLARWFVTLENDFFVMTYLGLLTRRVPADELQRLIVFPSKATEQVHALSILAKRMAGHPALWRAVEAEDEAAFERELAIDPPLAHALTDYLDAFGGRFANELKLESIGVDEDRRKLFSVLRAYRAYAPGASGEAVPMPSWFRQPFTRFLLSRFKKYAGQREAFRLLRSNAFSMARSLFRRVGAILESEGAIEKADDVFYLSIDEALAPLALSDATLKERVLERKREYAVHALVTPSPFFVLAEGETAPLEPPAPAALTANPASPGVVRGRVRIFREFSMPHAIDFDLLVASHTDPGWTALIALSKGLIIEHGGVLSHASIVARELGIPAVIGAKGAMDTLTNGQVVEINGATGSITME